MNNRIKFWFLMAFIAFIVGRFLNPAFSAPILAVLDEGLPPVQGQEK